MTDRAVALTRSYGRRLEELRTAARQTAANQWIRLARYDEADIDTWVEAMATFTAAARSAAARLTAGYLHAVARTNQPVLTADLPPVDPEKWRQPFMSTWATLSRTGDEAAALEAGVKRAGDTQAMIVTSTSRAASSVIDQSSPQLVGWNRVPDGNACNWCIEMASIDFYTADDAALNDQHDNCHCTPVPRTIDVAPGRDLVDAIYDAGGLRRPFGT